MTENAETSRHIAETEPELLEVISEDPREEGPSEPKRAKVPWQETLINLVATQQRQLDELVRQTKMATFPASVSSASSPTPNAERSMSAPVLMPAHAQTSFKVTNYDPSKSAYSMEEWLEDVTKLKKELNVSDLVMIAKTGEALKGRAHDYYCDWRPLCRSWDNFCSDLIIAFPDRETPGARAYAAATLRSHECESLCEYGNRKLRMIHRFNDSLPWVTVLSMVEYGLDHNEARSAIQIQNPTSERILLQVLSDFDARRSKTRDSRRGNNKASTEKPERRTVHFHHVDQEKSRRNFKRACFNCGQQGHQQATCFRLRKDNPREKAESTTVPRCDHCKKMGHTESSCWYKNEKPSKAFVLKK